MKALDKARTGRFKEYEYVRKGEDFRGKTRGEGGEARRKRDITSTPLLDRY